MSNKIVKWVKPSEFLPLDILRSLDLLRLSILSGVDLSLIKRIISGKCEGLIKLEIANRIIESARQIKEELYFSLLDRTNKIIVLTTSSRRSYFQL